MISWCDACATYLGDIPPFDDYSFAGTICPRCALSVEGRTVDASSGRKMFFEKIRQSASLNKHPAPAEILKEAAELGIETTDLLLGMIQPILYDTGKSWARDSLTIEQEHAFTATCSAVVDMAWDLFPTKIQYRHSEKPLVLLAVCDKNQHVLGVRLLELLLAAEDIASYLVYPGLPAHEIIKLVRRLQPTFLGVSIALKKHVRAIQDLLAAIEKIPGDERPILIAGGYSIRSGLSLDPALRVNSFADAKSFLNAMRPLVPRVYRAA